MFKKIDKLTESIDNLTETLKEYLNCEIEKELFKKEIQDQLDKIETKKVKKDGKLK